MHMRASGEDQRYYMKCFAQRQAHNRCLLDSRYFDYSFIIIEPNKYFIASFICLPHFVVFLLMMSEWTTRLVLMSLSFLTLNALPKLISRKR